MMEKNPVLKMGGSDGCTAMQMYLVVLNYILEMLKMVNFM